jgi:hypothetical protein
MWIVFAMPVTLALVGAVLTFRCLSRSCPAGAVGDHADAAPRLHVGSRGDQMAID